MEYALLNVTEENLIATVCVLITAGVLEDSVTVTLQTYPITGMFFSFYLKHIVNTLILQLLMEKTTLVGNLNLPFHLDNLCLETIHSALT